MITRDLVRMPMSLAGAVEDHPGLALANAPPQRFGDQSGMGEVGPALGAWEDQHVGRLRQRIADQAGDDTRIWATLERRGRGAGDGHPQRRERGGEGRAQGWRVGEQAAFIGRGLPVRPVQPGAARLSAQAPARRCVGPDHGGPARKLRWMTLLREGHVELAALGGAGAVLRLQPLQALLELGDLLALVRQQLAQAALAFLVLEPIAERGGEAQPPQDVRPEPSQSAEPSALAHPTRPIARSSSG